MVFNASQVFRRALESAMGDKSRIDRRKLSNAEGAMIPFGGWRFCCVYALGVFTLYITFSERAVATLTARAHAQGASTNNPVQWERPVRGVYENKGVARIERLGERWMLSVWCQGTHSTYLDPTTLDLKQYLDRFVTVRYSYVEREVADPKCLRAPCSPLHERRISIERITPLRITLEQARERGRQCK